MKKVLLTILWIACFSFYASAQCTFYGYYIDASGFLCGEGPGRICFLTSADWECPNGNYEVQISFPTGSFNYTELGEFSVLSFSQTTTVIHAPLGNISEGTTSYCLEGLIQVPNTVFSVQVVSLDDPTLILNPTTFTLDAANTIGSGAGVPLMSDAIDQGLVLDPTISDNTGQRVIIDGTLTIDEDYEFGNFFGGNIINEILMKPGASIVVKDGHNLSTFRANIHGCEDKWQKVLVEGNAFYYCSSSIINGGITAIELLNNATLGLFNSSLLHNDTGIGSFGPDQKNISLIIVPGSPFGFGNSIRSGIEGCHFENVNPLTINAYLYIRDMEKNGIYLDKTDLTASRISFTRCNYGIYVPTSNTLLSVTDCNFDDGFAGIVSLGSGEMQVKESEFYQLDYGIARTSAVVNEHTLIENNIFETCNLDVLGLVQQSRAEIQFNNMQAEQTNVAVWGLGAGSHKWAVQHNEYMLAGLSNENGYNVSYLYVKDGRIFRNITPYSTKYNFHLNGGSNCTVDYNMGCLSDDISIQANASPKALIACNESDGSNHAVSILNNCSGSTIRGNNMTSWTENLAYGSPANGYANTGPQPYRGNLFDPSAPGSAKAINFSTKQVAEANKYKAGFLANNQGTALFPFFNAADNQWFSKDENGLDYDCPPGLVGEDPKERLLASINANMSVLSAGVGTAYGKAAEFDAQLNLFRSLTELKQLQPLNAVQQAEENLLTGSVPAQYVAYERAYQLAVNLTTQEDALMAQLYQQITEANALALSMNMYQYNNHTEQLSIDQVQKNKLEAAIVMRNQKVDILKNLLQQKNNNLQAILNGLKNMVSNIPASTIVPVQNLKAANTLFLKRITSGFSSFSENELQQLTNIATQCVGTGGEGVYIARTLLAESTLSVATYNDECSGASAIERDNSGAPAPAGYFSVAPNPANDQVIVFLPRENNITRVYLTDIYGKEIMQKNVEGRQQVMFETAGIPPGIYFINASGLHKTIKLVIAR